MKFTKAKLHHKLRDTFLDGYRSELTIRGRPIDMFVFRDRRGWRALHYPSGFLLGEYLARPTRKGVAKAIAEVLESKVSDYSLSMVDRRSFDPVKNWAAPYEAA